MAEAWVAVISAAAVLTGVLLADIRQRHREREDRFTQLQREVFIELYAWTLRVGDWIHEPDSVAAARPILTPELRARLRIYLDIRVSVNAERTDADAATLASATTAEDKKILTDALPHRLQFVRELIEDRSKLREARRITRLRWRAQRILHPPLHESEPPWRELPRRERLRRRLAAVRRHDRTYDPMERADVKNPLL